MRAFLFPVVGACLPLLLFPACQPDAVHDLPPPVVETTEVAQRTVRDFTVFTGRTAAVRSVAVRARVSGYLQEIYFTDGQEVKAGDKLFLIDPRPYQAEAERAEADLKAAEADLTLARNEYNRAEELLGKQAISAQDFDNKAAALLHAEGKLGSAKAMADTARLNVEFTTITAAIDGQTSEASVSAGNLITPNMEMPLTTIVSVNPVYAYAEIDERQILKFIRANNEMLEKHPDREHGSGGAAPAEGRTKVAMQLADETGFPHEGTIDFSDNQVNPDTGTITVRAVFDDTDDVLLPGYFVRLRVPTSPEYTALLVPDRAIGIDQGQKFVYVLDAENKAQYRKVTPGALQSDGWRVVEGNLQPGERVIVEGLMKVRPGQQVDPRPWHQSEDAGESPDETVEAASATPVEAREVEE